MKIILQPEARTISNLEIVNNQQYLLSFISKAIAFFEHRARKMEQVDENS